MAADSRETWEDQVDGLRVGRCVKLHHCGDFIIGQQGDSSAGVVASNWYAKSRSDPNTSKPEFTGDDEFTLLILDREQGLFMLDRWLTAIPVTSEFYAIGSGAKVALGALYMGATAKQAVEAACKFDPFTGGDVVEAKLEAE